MTNARRTDLSGRLAEPRQSRPTGEQRRVRREEVVGLLRSTGLRPRRQSGQSFLIDDETAEDLVGAAEIRPGDRVLEIGPGFGIVTEALRAAGARVVGIELDRRLAQFLDERFRDDASVKIIQGDAIQQRLDQEFSDGRYKLVASLPFNITSLVLRNFLEHPPRPTLLALLIQKEVAERVVAPPGEMSLLSVAVQYLGRPSIVREVPRTSFFPQPEVDAAILRVEARLLPDEGARKAVFRTARVGFSSRRKMLHNNIATGFRLSNQKTQQLLREVGLDPTCRAQDLSVEQWKKLSKKLLVKRE